MCPKLSSICLNCTWRSVSNVCLLHLRFYVKSNLNYLTEVLHFLPCSLFTNVSWKKKSLYTLYSCLFQPFLLQPSVGVYIAKLVTISCSLLSGCIVRYFCRLYFGIIVFTAQSDTITKWESPYMVQYISLKHRLKVSKQQPLIFALHWYMTNTLIHDISVITIFTQSELQYYNSVSTMEDCCDSNSSKTTILNVSLYTTGCPQHHLLLQLCKVILSIFIFITYLRKTQRKESARIIYCRWNSSQCF